MHVAWDLAPPAAIRRHGERRARRRRLGGAAVAGLGLALAPVLMSVLLVQPASVTADGNSNNDSASHDKPGWISRVPAGFELDRGMTGVTRRSGLGLGDSADLSSALICGTPMSAFTQSSPASDTLAVSGSHATGSPERRVLMVFDDLASARAMLRSVRDVAGECASSGASQERIIGAAAPLRTSSSWAYLYAGVAARSAVSGPRSSVLVARVGNSVLLDHWSRTEPNAGADEQPSVEVTQLLRDMCIFDKGPCASSR